MQSNEDEIGKRTRRPMKSRQNLQTLRMEYSSYKKMSTPHTILSTSRSKCTWLYEVHRARHTRATRDHHKLRETISKQWRNNAHRTPTNAFKVRHTHAQKPLSNSFTLRVKEIRAEALPRAFQIVEKIINLEFWILDFYFLRFRRIVDSRIFL